MDRSLISAALVMAVGIALWLAIFPTLFRRKASDNNPPVFEPLLARVHQLRRGQFPVRHRHFGAVEARAKLLAAVRDKLDKKSFFGNRPPS